MNNKLINNKFLNSCDYCNELKITPNLAYNQLVEKYINIYNKKKCELSLNKLNVLAKISYTIERYIKKKYPEIYVILGPYFYSNMNKFAIMHSREIFINGEKNTNISCFVKCSFCYKEFCEFHLKYSCVKFTKCMNMSNKKCTKKLVVCGWCLETQDIKNNLVCILCDLELKLEQELKLKQELTQELKQELTQELKQEQEYIKYINDIYDNLEKKLEIVS